jgi:hypothetical protein
MLNSPIQQNQKIEGASAVCSLKISLVFLVSIFALLLSKLAEAQMTVDIAKITCRQYLFDKSISPEAPRIATWLMAISTVGVTIQQSI